MRGLTHTGNMDITHISVKQFSLEKYFPQDLIGILNILTDWDKMGKISVYFIQDFFAA